MEFDRKLLLIAPTIVLAFIAAGMLYASTQLRVISATGDTWKQRNDFVASVEHGGRTLDARQAIALLRMSLDVEARRTAAVDAAHDLLVVLALATVACWAVLVLGVRAVPRHYWPRLKRRRGGGDKPADREPDAAARYIP